MPSRETKAGDKFKDGPCLSNVKSVYAFCVRIARVDIFD